MSFSFDRLRGDDQMIYMVRLLWRLFRAVLSFVLRFFFGMVKAALVMAAILVGLFFYSQHASSPFARSLQTTFDTVTSRISMDEDLDRNLQELGLQNLTTDEHDANHFHGSRWATNKASVYIVSTDQTIVNAYEQALQAWNSTGAFTFTLAASKEQADIVLMDKSDPSSQAAGEAQSTSDARTNLIKHVDVYLNSYYLLNPSYGYSNERIINTAKHELGHAIGLDHNDAEISVMQSSGSYYGIQKRDIKATKELYETD